MISTVSRYAGIAADAISSEFSKRTMSRAVVTYTVPSNISYAVLATSSIVNFHEQLRFQSTGAVWTPGTPLVIGVTVSWSYTLGAKLPRGRYLAWSRALDAAGNIERKAKAHNLARFSIR